MPDPLAACVAKLVAFRRQRDWEQFHTPKNLAASICIEAAELLEHFQWQQNSAKISPAKREELAREMADVFIYLLLMSHDLKIDLLRAARKKLRENAKKYPVAKAKGTAKKYTEL